MGIKSVFITGANRGIGLEFVKQFLALPNPPTHLFATCRNPDKAEVRFVRNIRYILSRATEVGSPAKPIKHSHLSESQHTSCGLHNVKVLCKETNEIKWKIRRHSTSKLTTRNLIETLANRLYRTYMISYSRKREGLLFQKQFLKLKSEIIETVSWRMVSLLLDQTIQWLLINCICLLFIVTP